MQHQVVRREEWLAARLELLKEEKELTRRSDELARRRQELPWVRVDKGYRFETDGGSATLTDLFQGRAQLLVYHFMFGPDYKAGCPSCSAIADGFNGFVIHLANHDVMLWAVARAPLANLQAYKRRMGWTFPWASSLGSDFNFDFDVSFTEEQQRKGIDYNFRREPPLKSHGAERSGAPIPSRSTPDGPTTFAAMSGTDTATYTRERPGMSAFALEDGVVYHTYSAFARGVDGLWGMYQWLDRAPKGRNETGVWWRRHDEYAALPQDELDVSSGASQSFVKGFHGVRYLVSDVSRSLAFYSEHLGFKVEHQQLPAFANVSLGSLYLLLSGPKASGSRPMPDGQLQQPGGWNRVVLRVGDLPACLERLKKAGLQFRNAMEVGPGGKQIQMEDPDGNPIELFEPAK